MSTPMYIDSGVIAVVLLVLLAGFSFVWNRYLSKLGPIYQTLMDIMAIVLSLLVITGIVGWWLLRWFVPPSV